MPRGTDDPSCSMADARAARPWCARKSEYPSTNDEDSARPPPRNATTARLAMNKPVLTAPTTPAWGPSGRRRAVDEVDSTAPLLLFIQGTIHGMNYMSMDLSWMHDVLSPPSSRFPARPARFGRRERVRTDTAAAGHHSLGCGSASVRRPQPRDQPASGERARGRRVEPDRRDSGPAGVPRAGRTPAQQDGPPQSRVEPHRARPRASDRGGTARQTARAGLHRNPGAR